MTRRLSDEVFEFINRQGIDRVFLLPGGGAMHLVDAVSKVPNLKYVPVHHEQAAGIAAEYYSRIKCQPGVALVTTGPGATNIVTPFIGAWIESIPLLVISGQVKRTDIQKKEDNIRQSGVQEVDIISVVNSHAKYAVQIKDPLNIRFELEKAFYIMNNGRKGPVWIDIPLDVQAVNIPNWNELKKFVPDGNTISKLVDKKLDQLYKGLSSSSRPLLLVGHGVRLSKANKVLEMFVNKMKIPCVFTWNACDMIEFKNRFYIGKPGNVASRAANLAIQSCSYFISIGARLDNITTAYNSHLFARNAEEKWVLDIDENQLNFCSLNRVNKICVDAQYAIEYLLNKEEIYEKTEWVDHCNWLKNKYSTCDGDIPKSDIALTHFEASKLVSDAIPSNSIIITGSSGLAIEAFYVTYESKKSQRILLTSGLGAMGYGLPALVGALEANVEHHPTFLVESDGSLMLNLQELQTLKTSGNLIKIIILNNNGYCSIRATQRNYFKGNYVGSDINSGLEIPNFKKLADTFNFKYVEIDNDNKHLLDNYINSKESMIINIKLIENESLWPKVSAFQNKDGLMVSMPIEDMNPLISLEELKKALGSEITILDASKKARNL